MQRIVKRVISFFLVPITKWYLQKKRTHTFEGTTVAVWPGVFHPGFFSSTHFLIEFLKEQSLKGKTLLELGCGTGLISIFSAKSGAIVTASDLNAIAIKNITANAKQNSAELKIIHSDLFEKIDKQSFDWIVINPPYYPHDPKNEEQLAWNCGEHFEYFQKLFKSLSNYMTSGTQSIMVLSQDCDLEKIISIANENDFQFTLIKEKKVLLDGKNFIYRISKNQE